MKPTSMLPELLDMLDVPHNSLIVYKDGAVDIPHWGVSFRSVFGAAVAGHDMARDGRLVKVTLKGVYIATIQLADGRKKLESVRQDPVRS